jgi:hypothetical protein
VCILLRAVDLEAESSGDLGAGNFERGGAVSNGTTTLFHRKRSTPEAP